MVVIAVDYVFHSFFFFSFSLSTYLKIDLLPQVRQINDVRGRKRVFEKLRNFEEVDNLFIDHTVIPEEKISISLFLKYFT